jgi:hypothetical protein
LSSLIIILLGSHFLFLFIGDCATITDCFTFSIIASFLIIISIDILISCYYYLQFFLLHFTLTYIFMPYTDSLLALRYLVFLLLSWFYRLRQIFMTVFIVFFVLSKYFKFYIGLSSNELISIFSFLTKLWSTCAWLWEYSWMLKKLWMILSISLDLSLLKLRESSSKRSWGFELSI